MIWKGKNLRGFLHRAVDVLFDNTGTGLSATNVQGAIDEVSGDLSTSVGRIITKPFDKTSSSTFTEIYNFTASSTGQVMAQAYFESASGKYAGIQIRVNGYVVHSWGGMLTSYNTIAVNCSFKKGDVISIRTSGESTLPAVNVSIDILE